MSIRHHRAIAANQGQPRRPMRCVSSSIKASTQLLGSTAPDFLDQASGASESIFKHKAPRTAGERCAFDDLQRWLQMPIDAEGCVIIGDGMPAKSLDAHDAHRIA